MSMDWLKTDAKFHHIRDQGRQKLCMLIFAIQTQNDKIDNLSIDLAKLHNIRDQHHRKPPYANLRRNQIENDKIDNLSIDFWSIDR